MEALAKKVQEPELKIFTEEQEEKNLRGCTKPSKMNLLAPKGMLLRLFQSDLFTADLAIFYTFKYCDEIGIQYYLCERLKDMPTETIFFLVPQLCHVLVTNGREFCPLEFFVYEICRDSLHFSIEIMWILESYLNDLRKSGKNLDLFLRVSRILFGIHRILFRGNGLESRESFDKTFNKLCQAKQYCNTHYKTQNDSSFREKRCEMEMLAFGNMLSAFCFPMLARAIHPLVQIGENPMAYFDFITKNGYKKHEGTLCKSRFQEENFNPSSPLNQSRYLTQSQRSLLSLNMEALNHALPNESEPTGLTVFPSIPLYYHQEMQFIASLVKLSQRLSFIETENRAKSMLAELKLINDSLPASVCLPTWCKFGHEHQKILNIVVEESKILNSAERVPYMIILEVVDECSEQEFHKLLDNPSKQGSRTSFDSLVVEEETGESVHVSSINERLKSDLNLIEFGENELSIKGIIDVAERMKTAAIMLAQLAKQAQIPGTDLNTIAAIRSRIIKEMEALEKERFNDALENTSNVPTSQLYFDAGKGLYCQGELSKPRELSSNQIDSEATIFKEAWELVRERIKKRSRFSHLRSWNLISLIVKTGADIRQERLALQMISEMKRIFDDCGLDIFLLPYKVLPVAYYGGLIETVPNATSIHMIRKIGIMTKLREASDGRPNDTNYCLKDFFIAQFGDETTARYKEAIDNFIKSLAGYSLMTFLLQVRDRHNGNILLDSSGHLIHIDFGFMLSNSPGYIGFESAPFKLSADYIDLLDGIGSEKWTRFKDLLTCGFLALRKHADRLLLLLELMLRDSSLPCLYSGESAFLQFKDRFQLHMTEDQVGVYVDRLVTTSAFNIFSRLYDSFQYYTNNIF